jgi:hypothetical protein
MSPPRAAHDGTAKFQQDAGAVGIRIADVHRLVDLQVRKIGELGGGIVHHRARLLRLCLP